MSRRLRPPSAKAGRADTDLGGWVGLPGTTHTGKQGLEGVGLSRIKSSHGKGKGAPDARTKSPQPNSVGRCSNPHGKAVLSSSGSKHILYSAENQP